MIDEGIIVAIGTGPRYDPFMVPISDRLTALDYPVTRVTDFAALRAVGVLERVELLISNVLRADFLSSMPRLRAVINPVTGSEMIDSAAATRHRVVVGVGQAPENCEGLAEGTFMMMLNALKDMPAIERGLRQPGLQRPVTARQLGGRTVGMIGFGRIAQGVARRLQGWNARILVAAPRVPVRLPDGVNRVALDVLLADSDIVLVLCSLSDETRGLLDRNRLAQMKPGAILVNTARGAIVDEAALYAAARDGQLAYVALDCFEIEPLPDDSPLRTLPNAILTPHRVGHSVEGQQALIAMAVDNVQRVLAGAPPAVVLNPEVLPDWTQATAARS